MEQLKMVGVGLALIGLAGAGMVYGFGGEEQADDHGRHQIRRAQFQGLAGSHIGVSVSDVEEADARRGAIIMDVARTPRRRRPDSLTGRGDRVRRGIGSQRAAVLTPRR